MFELLRATDKKVPFLIYIYNEFDNIYDTRSKFYRTISKEKPTLISSSLYSLNDNINNIKNKLSCYEKDKQIKNRIINMGKDFE